MVWSMLVRRVPAADGLVGGGAVVERARHVRQLRRVPGARVLVGRVAVVERTRRVRQLRRVPRADVLVAGAGPAEHFYYAHHLLRLRRVAAAHRQVLGAADGAGVEETAAAAVGVDRRRGRRLGPGAAGVIGELVGADAAAVGVPRGAAVGEQAPCSVSNRRCRCRSPQRPHRARPRRARAATTAAPGERRRRCHGHRDRPDAAHALLGNHCIVSGNKSIAQCVASAIF